MLSCILWAINVDEAGKYTPNIAHAIAVFGVKVPCIFALHLLLSPEVENAMKLMKFANQQSHQFVPYGSIIGFCLGVW